MTSKNATRRRVFMVLSPRSLPYAQLALQSFIHKALESTTLCLITDSDADKIELQDKVLELLSGEVDRNRHGLEVYSEGDLSDLAAEKFNRLQYLRKFRTGHPCWRKITDPLLLTNNGEEMILLDPDYYFLFCFFFVLLFFFCVFLL